ncbi:hypothetical protein [Thalassomonas actiniarum]|uniref:Lipoprotein n=1 Tax=Thalassomonas actiniarum TaxID=485447 RepID=A0AAE9YSW7_9GAMM|nr:hypothetical protein [Thalassomonas actiniarum]WDD99674.1 hypothetical protein SG35_003095 [Thalassomonas actiniarum]
MINKAQFCGWLSMLCLLSACSSRQEKSVEEIFVTQIREDNSKMFAFTLRQEKAARSDKTRDKMATGKQGKRGKGAGRNKSAGRGEKQERENPLATVIQQKLEQRLNQSRYCTTGYLELERYASRAGMTVRGECNESATADDRLRFPNRVNGEI